jgi:hypothetical protein
MPLAMLPIQNENLKKGEDVLQFSFTQEMVDMPGMYEGLVIL